MLDISSIATILSNLCNYGRIHVISERDNGRVIGRPRSYWFPCQSPQELTPLNGKGKHFTQSQPDHWVRANNGADLGYTNKEFILHASKTAGIIKVRQIRKRTIPIGEGIRLDPPPSGGPLPRYTLQVDLDTSAAFFLDSSKPWEPIESNMFTISETDPLNMVIYAKATRASYEWSIELEFIRGSRRKVITFPTKKEDLRHYTTVGLNDAENLPSYGRVDDEFFPSEEWHDHTPFSQ